MLSILKENITKNARYTIHNKFLSKTIEQNKTLTRPRVQLVNLEPPLPVLHCQISPFHRTQSSEKLSQGIIFVLLHRHFPAARSVVTDKLALSRGIRGVGIANPRLLGNYFVKIKLFAGSEIFHLHLLDNICNQDVRPSKTLCSFRITYLRFLNLVWFTCTRQNRSRQQSGLRRILTTIIFSLRPKST